MRGKQERGVGCKVRGVGLRDLFRSKLPQACFSTYPCPIKTILSESKRERSVP